MKHGALTLAVACLFGALLTGPALAQITSGAPPIMGAPPHTLGAGAPETQAQPTQARSPRAPQTAALPAGQGPLTGQRETEALNLLEAQGFGNFTDFHAEGANFAATVSNPGGSDSYAVLVNPDNGQVTRR